MKGKFPRPFALRLVHFRLFGGDLRRAVGIEVSDQVKVVKSPSIERLNAAVELLKKLNRNTEAEKLKLAFYERMLELGNFETANFIGLARSYFELGDVENAKQTLQKLGETENFSDYITVAEIFAEFGLRAEAIEFRRKQMEFSPFDHENKLELAKLLPAESAVPVLLSIVNERNALRGLRWKANLKLQELGELIALPNYDFDAYSQFYTGNFLNSLIVDNSLEIQALQQLIKVYASSNQLFAALKLAEIDKSAKDDELLDLLSKSAEKVGEFQKAIEFERSRVKIDGARIKMLESLKTEQNKRTTDFVVDIENTKKL